MRLTIRLIDRATQGLSKTPLIVFIGRLHRRGVTAIVKSVAVLLLSQKWCRIMSQYQDVRLKQCVCIPPMNKNLPTDKDSQLARDQMYEGAKIGGLFSGSDHNGNYLFERY